MQVAIHSLWLSVVIFGFLGVFPIQFVDAADQNPPDPDTITTVEDIEKLFESYEGAMRSGDMSQAREHIDLAISRSKEFNFEELLPEAYHFLGDWYLRRGVSDSAIVILEEARSKYDPDAEHIELNNMLANAYRFDGRLTDALNLYYQVLAEAEEQNAERIISGLKQNIGVVYGEFGRHEESLDYYQQTLDYAEAARDTSLKIVVANSIGRLNTDLGNYSAAETYLTRSIDLAQEYGSMPDLIYAYLNLGNLYKAQGNSSRSVETYQKGLEVAETINNVRLPVQIHYNMGEMYLDAGNYDQARDEFERSLSMSRELSITNGIYYNNYGLGRLANETGDYEAAVNYLQQALDIAYQIGSKRYQLDVYQQLASTNENQQDYQAAYANLRKAKSYADSLSSEEKDQLLAQYEAELGLEEERLEKDLLEQRYEAQQTILIISLLSVIIIGLIAFALFRMNKKKHRLNRQLEARNDELKNLYQEIGRQNEKLVEINKTNKKLFGILGHDLRGPISNLQAVLHLVRNKAIDAKQFSNYADRIDGELNQTVTTLENFLSWAKTQLQGFKTEIRQVEIQPLVEEVFQTLRFKAAEKGIRLINHVEESLIIETDENMLRIVLVNLVHNGIKFSNLDDSITIEAFSENGYTVFKVIDTGMGIEKQDQEKLFEAFYKGCNGTAGESGSGLGLSLCKEFIELKNGDIWMESEPGEGTTFIFRIPNGDKITQNPNAESHTSRMDSITT